MCREQLVAAEERERRLAHTFAFIQTEMPLQPDEAPLHLSDEQVIGYVDQALDEFDREIADSHLEGCGRCVAAVEELRRFQAVMSTHPPEVYHPSTSLPLRQRLQAFLTGLAVWLQPQRIALTATAAATLVFLGTKGLALRNMAALAQQEAHRATVQVAQSQERARQAEVRSERLQQQVARVPRLEAELQRLQEKNRELQHDLNRPSTPRSTSPRTEPPLAYKNMATVPVMPDARGRLVQALPPPPAVREALSQRRIETPNTLLASLTPRSMVTMGSGERPPFTPKAPVGTVILTDRPVFSWSPLKEAAGYRVELFDISSGQDNPRSVLSQDVAKTEWQPPRPLPRGRTYEWEVTAFRKEGNVVAPSAKFRVLEAAKAEELARYSGSLLTMGVLYAQAGMLEEAEELFQQVLQTSPDSTTARQLLQHVRAQRSPRP
jgi:hypothetical protein